MVETNRKEINGDMKITIEGEGIKCSDGFHTFDELYEHRIVLFIALCKHFPTRWKSKLHADGSSFAGWFIMGIGKEKGNQISYHLPMRFWNECEFVTTLDKSPEWDGHTSNDVLKRLSEL